jgi:polyisoprenoid-binding protein YceI
MSRLAQFAMGSALAALLIVGSQHADAGHAIRPVKTDVPGTTCSLDKAHASLIFRVSHLAFSNWTGRFANFDARLMLDSKNPANSHVEATIDPNSLASDNPPPGFPRPICADCGAARLHERASKSDIKTGTEHGSLAA